MPAGPEPVGDLPFQPELVKGQPPQPEFVGGPPLKKTGPRHLLAITLVSAGGLLAILLVATGVWLWSDSRHEILGLRPAAGIEPASARAFTQALHRGDPATMRAQVTPVCIADSRSRLCFDPTGDQQFRAAMTQRSIEVTFINRFESRTGTVVIYDVYVNDKVTGKGDDLVLVLRLAQDGKIDHAFVT